MLVAAYEQRHFPLDLPDPVEAVKFVMEQRGLTAKALEPMIASSSVWTRRNRGVWSKMVEKSIETPLVPVAPGFHNLSMLRSR